MGYVSSNNACGLLVACFSDGQILFWKLDTLALKYKINFHQMDFYPSAFSLSTDGNFFVVIQNNGQLLLWNLKTMKLEKNIYLRVGTLSIQQMEFIGNSLSCLIIMQHSLWIINNITEDDIQLKQLSIPEPITQFWMSKSGTLAAGLTMEREIIILKLNFFINAINIDTNILHNQYIYTKPFILEKVSYSYIVQLLINFK